MGTCGTVKFMFVNHVYSPPTRERQGLDGFTGFVFGPQGGISTAGCQFAFGHPAGSNGGGEMAVLFQPPCQRPRFFSSSFIFGQIPPSPRARVRRMDQVVHMGHVGYDYPIAVQEQQNLAYGKGASPEGSGSGTTDTTPPSVKDKAA